MLDQLFSEYIENPLVILSIIIRYWGYNTCLDGDRYSGNLKDSISRGDRKDG
jgi:hypothetical protein